MSGKPFTIEMRSGPQSKLAHSIKPGMKAVPGRKAEPQSQRSNKSIRSVSGLITSVSIKSSCKTMESHSETVLNGLYVMWKQKFLCDVILKVGDQTLYGHRALLASCCDYFHDLFSDSDVNADEEIEVTLSGISPTTVSIILECMYTGKVHLNELNVREVLAAAKYLKFYHIENACSEFLVENLNKSNCLRMLNLSFTFKLNGLTEKCLKTAAEHFTELSTGIDFHHLEPEHVIALLSRDEILTETRKGELEVFEAALSWLDFDKRSRLDHAVQILQAIRLPLLDPTQIVDHVESVNYLMKVPACQDLVKEALHYHCLPARQSILQSTRTTPRCSSKVTCVVTMGGAPRMKNDPVGRDVMYYDPSSCEWSYLAGMNEPRHHHAVATLGGFLYIAGGEQTNDQRSPLNTAYRYDPRNNSWLQIASMKYNRESFQLGVLNGMLYAVGGRVDAEESLCEVERYNPADDRWDEVAPISSPRRSVALVAHNGRLYAIGGSGENRICGKVERYNPLVDEWEARRALQTPRFFAMLASVANRLYLLGGATVDSSGSVTCCSTVDCYNPLADSWTTITTMLDPRAEASCCVIGTKIYIVGGYSWDKLKRLSSVVSYDAEKDRWTEETPLAEPYTGVGVCALTLYFKDKPSFVTGKSNEETDTRT